MKNSNLKSDFEIAEKINNHLFIPSDCFDLENIPSVHYIIGARNIQTRHIAEQLAAAIESKSNFRPQILIRGEFNALEDGSLSDFASAENLLSFLREQNIVLEDAVIIASGYSAKWFTYQEKTSDGVNINPFNHTWFCLKECFMHQNLGFSRSFIRKGEEFWNDRKVLKNCDCIVLYSEVTSVFNGALLWCELQQQHGKLGPSGKPRRIICSGLRTFFSQLMYKGSPIGEILKGTCLHMGMPKDAITVMKEYEQHADNLSELDQNIKPDEIAIMVVPQRYSLPLKYTQMCVCPQLKLSYYVLYQEVCDAVHLYNGLKLCNGRPFLSYCALLGDKIRHDKNMAPVNDVDNGILQFCCELKKRHHLYNKEWTFDRISEFASLSGEIFTRRVDIRTDYHENVGIYLAVMKKDYPEIYKKLCFSK